MQRIISNKFGKGVDRKSVGKYVGNRWFIIWRRLRRDRIALVGGAIVLAFIIIAIFAKELSPYSPTYQQKDGLSNTGLPLPRSEKYILGTDRFGRDVLSRLIFGARVSLTVGIAANGLMVLIGVSIGIVAGYIGGRVELILMRLTDIALGIPQLLFAMTLVAVWGSSLTTVIVVLSITNWTYMARIIHGEVLSIKEMDYITASRALGASKLQIMISHVLPQLTSLIIVYLSLGVSTTIILEASLSYLGMGVPPPTPSWGSMIADGQNYFRLAPWLVIYPGIAIVLSVMGFNLLGDGLRDALVSNYKK